jgi:hypothetical protein
MAVQIIESRDGGREFVISVDMEGDAPTAVVPRELLDDEVGSEAPEDERRRWIANSDANIAAAVEARLRGGQATPPFDRIVMGS